MVHDVLEGGLVAAGLVGSTSDPERAELVDSSLPTWHNGSKLYASRAQRGPCATVKGIHLH